VLADARLLPIGAVKVAGTEFDFTEPRRIGHAVLDTTFGDVDLDADGGSAVTIAAPDGSGRVAVWGDGTFKWWQIFTGDTLHGERFRRSVAIEPMTCPPDAFRSGRDLIVLAPGQNWSATWGISPSDHPATALDRADGRLS
jgi:aldose 1-epimerase